MRRTFWLILSAVAVWIFPVVMHAATLSVSPASGSFLVGSTMSVNILLDTQGSAIDGVDVRYLNYNPAVLQVIDVTPGSLLPITTFNKVDQTNGRITFSQVTTSGGPKFTSAGAQTLAVVRFNVIAMGSSGLTFNFTSGNTTDSNVSSNQSDILMGVTNGNYALAATTLSAALVATPNSGQAPLTGVDLIATVSGTQSGTINYTFYCNRVDAGTNITLPYTIKFDNLSQTSYSIIDICNYPGSGTYTAKVIVERGSLAAESRATITVTALPPGPIALSVSEPVAGAVIAGTAVDVRYTAVGDVMGNGVDHVHFQLDSNPEIRDLDFDGFYQFTGVPFGSHTIIGYLARADHSKVAGTDISVSFTTTPPPDTAAPVISAVVASGITESSAVISWVTDELSTSQVEYGITTSYGSLTTEAASLVSAHTVTLSNLSPNTTYNFRVKSKDAAGNTGQSLNATFSTSPVPDTTAPQAVGNLVFSNLSQTSALLSWTAPSDLPGGGAAAEYDIRYSTSLITAANFASASLATGEPVPASPGSNQTYTLAGLTSGTTYYTVIVSRDAAGNTSLLSNVISFTTQTAGDVTPPVISSVTASSITTNSAVISWMTNEPATRQVEYGLSTAYGLSTPEDSTLLTTHTQTVSGLTPNTTYHYRVVSRDAAGNISRSSDDTFTTSVVTLPTDTTPPIISGIQVTTLTDTAATVAWITDESADSTVLYGTASTSLSSQVTDGNRSTAHSLLISSLMRNTRYFYQVKSKDAANNEASSKVFSFQTASRLPKPPKVKNLQARQGSVVLSWENPTDYEFFGGVLIIKKEGSSIDTPDIAYKAAQTSNTSYTDPDVSAGKTYYYTLFTYDDQTVYSDPEIVSLTIPSGSPSTGSGSSSGGGGGGGGGSSGSSGGGGGGGGGGGSTTQPVPAPSNVVARGGENQIIITWDNPTNNTNFVRVRVIRKEGSAPLSANDGTVVYEGVQDEFTDMAVSPGKTYHYGVFSLDQSLYASPIQKVSAKLGDKTNAQVAQEVSAAINNTSGNTTPSVQTPAIAFIRQLYLGLEGEDVKALQQILVDEQLLGPGSTTGFFGPLTEKALREFQVRYNLVQGGGVNSTGWGATGPVTRQKLNEIAGKKKLTTLQPVVRPPASTSSVSLTRSLYRGYKGADVQSMQTFFIQKGYLAIGNDTGFFGALTESAVKKFQCDTGLVCSGTTNTTGYGGVGPKTRQALNQQTSTSPTSAATSATDLQNQINALQKQVQELLKKLQGI